MGRAKRQRIAAQRAQARQDPPWTPFEAYQEVPGHHDEPAGRVWENSRYTVAVRRIEPAQMPGHQRMPVLVHLSIHRRDREAIHDWRDLQRIKNELVGPECEGFEVYPPESHLVDTANEYHLWCFAEPGYSLGIGWTTRLVSEGPYRTKARQRPFELDVKPSDLKTEEEMDQMARDAGIDPSAY